MIDTKILLPGEDFSQLRKLYVIFIVNGDVFGGGCQIYTIQKNIEPMGIAFRDESDILYVNTRCQDDTDVGRLCHDFHASDPEMVYDDILRERMRALKDSKEGDSYMCELVDELMREVEEKVRKQEHDKAFVEGKISMVKILKQEGVSDEVIAKAASATVEQVKEWCM